MHSSVQVLFSFFDGSNAAVQGKLQFREVLHLPMHVVLSDRDVETLKEWTALYQHITRNRLK